VLAAPPPSDAFLLVHAWVEPDGPDPLRIRITAVPRLDAAAESVAAAASVDDAVECVREWLDRFVASNIAGDDAGAAPEIP